jgi:nucleotide-binding universal stress UspA family protein
MFKVIVWATDGSSAAAQALPYVKSLAQTDRSRIVVVHVDEFGVGRGGLYSLYVDEAEVQAAIRRQVADLKREGFDVKLRTARMLGGAAPMIAEIAKDEGAHLIVVGTRGLGLISGLLLGSVTHRLVQNSPCPLLVVPTTPAQTCRYYWAWPAGRDAEIRVMPLGVRPLHIH